MKLLLVCTAAVLLISAVELARSPRRRKYTINKFYDEAGITPVPENTCELCYEDYVVSLGMEVRPEDVQGVPDLEIDYELGCYFAVIMWTPDYPCSNNSYMSPYLLWMTMNNYESSEGCVESCEIASLLNPSPSPGTGIHRYVVEVYKQYEMIDTTADSLCGYQYERYNFSSIDFVKTYNLVSTPVYGCVFTSQYPYSEY